MLPANPGSGQNKPGLIYTLPGVLLLVAAYALVHIAARLGASGNLGEDDPLDNLLIQTLEWGYSPTQPPLYDWLLWGLQQVLGAGVHAFLMLKYAMLVALAGFLFLIARRLTNSPFWALLAVDAMALTYQIFWRFHEGFTHRVGAMTLALATVWALLRLLDRSRGRDYALFGLLAGLGLLTEPSFGLLLLALLAAALLQPAARLTVLAPGMLLALLLALVAIAPYGLWLLAEPGRLAAFQAELLPWPQTRSLGAGLAALGTALTTPVLVLSPYIFILPAVFPGVMRVLWRQTPVSPLAHAVPDFRQLLLHVLLIQFALLAVGGLLQQRTHYAVHSLLPMFVVAIAWLTAKVQEAAPSPRRIRVFVAFSLIITVVALLGRVANMYVLEPVCKTCRWGTPYVELAREMRAAGFDRGTILTPEVELGGNLRRLFPEDRIVVPAVGYLPPETARSRAGQVAIVWNARQDRQAVLAQLRPYLPGEAAFTDAPDTIKIPWPHLWKPEGYRYSDWQLVVLPRR
jgi:4-amino-4-deoxy-L-arabinose transferase-like glycosyltransferase